MTEVSRNTPSPFACWDDLRFFLATSVSGSFSKAASNLGVTQPTISRRIENLEYRLGVQLFDRLPTGVTLTTEGQSILGRARQIEEAVLEIQRSIAGHSDRVEGTVRISVTDGLSAYWLTPKLIEFEEIHPQIAIEIVCSIEPADALRMETDLSIRFRAPEEPNLVAVRLGTFHFVPWASPDYLSKHGTPGEPAELMGHRLLDHFAYYDDDGDWDSWLSLARTANLMSYRTNSSPSLLAAIQNGLGIGLLPTYTCEFATGVVPLNVGIQTSSHIWLAYHSGLRKTARVRAVVGWLRSLFDRKATPWFQDDFFPPRPC